MAERFTSRFHDLLGTVVEITLQTGTSDVGTSSEDWAEARVDESIDAIAGEIRRLQRVFSVFDPSSEIRRWQRGETGGGPELSAVLSLAADWRERTGGVFDPAVGRMTELWNDAAARGVPPTDDELAAAVDGTAVGRNIGGISLNAVAKGWIVDRAVEFGRALRVDGTTLDAGQPNGVTVNAGGDLRHDGPSPLIVGIENPARPYDNEPPLATVELIDGALATSGDRRRGWTIRGEWLGHVIDPRTARPVGHVTSATVVAPDAATADVLATALTVWCPDEGIAFVDAYSGAECMVVGADGAIWRSGGWTEVSSPRSTTARR